MLTTAKALETLFPGTRHRIIAAIFLEPERWWSLGDLGVELAMPPLGLRHEMAALCGGGILIRSRLSRRTCFRPDPACPFFSELQAMAAKCTTGPKRERCETILVVEDEPATLKISRILLESWGYRVIEAHSPFEAMDLFERNEHDIRLVLNEQDRLEERLKKIEGLVGAPAAADELEKKRRELEEEFELEQKGTLMGLEEKE